jgi:hypothetical protein
VRSTPLEETSMPTDAFWVAGKESAESGFLDAGANASGPDDAADSIPVLDPLPLGTWVDLQLDGRTVRANLRWTSPYQNLYLFVGNDGMQHSMTRKSLDKLRASGMVRVVAQGGVVAAALDRVAGTALKNSAKHSSGSDSDADAHANASVELDAGGSAPGADAVTLSMQPPAH